MATPGRLWLETHTHTHLRDYSSVNRLALVYVTLCDTFCLRVQISVFRAVDVGNARSLCMSLFCIPSACATPYLVPALQMF